MSFEDYAQRMMALFAGSTSAHGTHGKTLPASNGAKVEIKPTAQTIKEPVTPELWEAHLDGRRALGIIPIRDDGTCVWGAIDVDDYAVNHAELVDEIGRQRLPMLVCRSKSGGAHLYVFLREPRPAAAVRAFLNLAARRLGLDGCEIFPKQECLDDEGEFGNWLNMPYHGDERRAVKLGGLEMGLVEFVSSAEAMRVSTEQFTQLMRPSIADARPLPQNASGENSSLDGAPPCIEAMVANGVREHEGRNNALFHIGVFARKRSPGDWERRLEELNQQVMRPPLPAEELVGIKKSLRRKDYGYKCGDQPMCSLCDRQVCSTKQWGVGGTAHPAISSWRKVMSDEPAWHVRLVGSDIDLVLTDIRDLTSYRRFADQCARQLGRFFLPMKQEKWSAMLRDKEGELIQEAAAPELTPEGRFIQVLEDFLTDRMQGKSKDDVLRGVPWEDEEEGRYYFRIQDIERAVKKDGRLPNVLPHQYEKWIKNLGGGPLGPRKLKGRSVRLWWVPSSAVERTEPLDPPPPQTRDF